MNIRLGCVVVGFLLIVLGSAAQTANPNSTSSQVPPLIQFANLATDEGGSPLSGVVSITFSLYATQQGGQPLWSETQNNIQLDSTGHYSVELGITKPNGVPTTLFTTGEARWLGVQIAEQAEQTRVLLLSVPYALKAGDAATIGGLPPSAFVLAAPPTGSAQAASLDTSATAQTSAPSTDGPVTGAGTVNFVPLWDSTSDIVSSVISQQSAGGETKVQIGTTRATTQVTIDASLLNVGGNVRADELQILAASSATASTGSNSGPIYLGASSYDSSTSAPVAQSFVLQAEPYGNDSGSPSGTLNLLFGSGTAKPAETGLNIASNGVINFAAGQTFPGAGTITGITTATGSGLTGGGASGDLSLGLTTACAINQVLQWNGSSWACATLSGGSGTITGVTAGTGLTGGGTSGAVTLNVNTALIPQLTAANTFTGNQTVNGNLSSTGTVSGSSFQIGSSLFAYGSAVDYNAFLGFAGSSPTAGVADTGVGYQALFHNTSNLNTATGYQALDFNTTGTLNTATGAQALTANTSGVQNTAIGVYSLYSNTTGNNNVANGYSALNTSNGSFNTAVGAFAGPLPGPTSSLNDMTAIGANAIVSQADSLVLGQTTQGEPGNKWVSVGIGTDTPRSILEAAELKVDGVGPTITLTNPFPAEGISNTSADALDFNTYVPSTTGTYNPAARIEAVDAGTDNFSANILFLSNKPGAANGGLQTNLTILSTGLVGIATSAPAYPLDVSGIVRSSAGGFMFPDGSVQTKAATGGGGGGTVTSVASGAGLTGGPITSSGTLSIATGGVSNSMLANPSLTVTAGTGLTGGGAVTLGGSATLSVDTTKVPELAAANTFTGNQTINANILLPNTTSGGTQGVIDFGGVPFIHNYGPSGSYNAFFGRLAGSVTNAGYELTAVGDFALGSDTSGTENTALGYNAGQANTTGSGNTFLGSNANPGSNNLNNSTAIGANAVVSESNALVLGGTGLSAVNVGIGTATPQYTLDVKGSGNFTGPVNFAAQTINATGTGLSATSSNSSGEAVYAINTSTSGTNFAVFAQSTSPQSTGVAGTGGYFGVEGDTSSTTAGAAGVVGQANGNGQTEGVYGLNFSTTAGSAGVVGNAAGSSSGTSGNTFGVYGENASPNGVGVYGVALGPSVVGSTLAGYAFGVWGDSNGLSALASEAVLGTADNTVAGVFVNNSSLPTLEIANRGNGGTGSQNGVTQRALLLAAYGEDTGKGCTIDVGGTLNCEGTVTAVVPTNSGARKVSLYAVQSPENWFEDFGSGTLSNGAVTIALDPTFAQTVNTATEYHVFLTPNGDSKGLYVSQKTATSFEVREQGGGHSNITFDYRIVAKRSGYENVRLTDVTEQYKKMEEQRELRRGQAGQRPVRPAALPRTIPLPQLPRIRAAQSASAQPLIAQPK